MKAIRRDKTLSINSTKLGQSNHLGFAMFPSIDPVASNIFASCLSVKILMQIAPATPCSISNKKKAMKNINAPYIILGKIYSEDLNIQQIAQPAKASLRLWVVTS